MLHTEAVEASTLGLLRRLMQDNRLSDFLLAGGTNLALRLGHRKSVDLDLFTYQHFDAISLAEHLTQNYHFEKTDVRDEDTVKGYIDDIKVDMIAHLYPPIDQTIVFERMIRLYGYRDMAAMKLAAVSDNGKRLKDFVDIAYLSSIMSLNQMIDAYAQKYKNASTLHAIRGLSYFDDIVFDVTIDLINSSFNWKIIKKRIFEMIKYENRIFETMPC